MSINKSFKSFSVKGEQKMLLEKYMRNRMREWKRQKEGRKEGKNMRSRKDFF